MFKSLKNKLTGWFNKESEEVKEKPEKKKESKEIEKKKGLEKKSKNKIREGEPMEKEDFEQHLKEEVQKIKEEVPLKFEVGKQKFEPDLERLEENIDKYSLQNNEEKAEKEKSFFGKLAKKLITSELTENDFDEFFEEFEVALLENNVALEVVDKIKENLRKELVGHKFKKKEVGEKILEALKNSIDSVLIEPESLIEKIKDKKKPFVILFFGINGSGKTTSIAKLAHSLKQKGFNCVLAAGDTFRAASIEQLEKHANNLNVEIVKGDYGKDPASVAFDAITFAKKNKKDVVLIDTAGRMYTKSNLMKEMEKIVKVSKPDLKIFVGESITGNDATEQAEIFNETAGIDGIILSKADVDEKAGAILSVSFVTGKPILFLGVGQNYKDLQEFKKNKVLENLGLN